MSQVEAVEQPRNIIDSPILDQTVELFAAAANVEAKTATLGIIALEDRWLTCVGIQNSLRGRATDTVTRPSSFWLPSASVLKNYCRTTFEPIGAVVQSRTTTAHGETDVFRIVEGEQRDRSLIVAGLAGRWGLDYAEVSLQAVYGRTSRSANAENRAITGRINVLSQLIDYPGSSLTDTNGYILPSGERVASFTSNIVEALESAGLVTVETKSEDNPRDFLVVTPDKNLSTLYVHEENMRLSTNLFHDWIETLPAGTHFTFETGFNAVRSLAMARDIQFDPAELRSELGALTGAGHTLPQLQKGDIVRGHKHTSITIKPEYLPAVKDAVGIFKAMAVGEEDVMERGREDARTILSSPKSVAALLNKSRDHSAMARQQSVTDTTAAITSILSTSERMDAFEMREALVLRDIKLSIPRLRSILSSMISDDALAVRVDRAREATQQKRNFYSLPD